MTRAKPVGGVLLLLLAACATSGDPQPESQASPAGQGDAAIAADATGDPGTRPGRMQGMRGRRQGEHGQGQGGMHRGQGMQHGDSMGRGQGQGRMGQAQGMHRGQGMQHGDSMGRGQGQGRMGQGQGMHRGQGMQHGDSMGRGQGQGRMGQGQGMHRGQGMQHGDDERLATLLAQVPPELEEGQRLFDQICTVCHTMEPPPNLAPPMGHVARRLRDAFDEEEALVDFILDYVPNPDEAHSKLPAMARERFGLMPPLPLAEPLLEQVARYIWYLGS